MENQELIKQVTEKAEKWLTPAYDAETQAEVKRMLENDDKTELIEAFYKDLEFGTGGLRGIMGVGSNRMNIYTVGAATQGLSNYLKKNFKDLPQISVVVGVFLLGQYLGLGIAGVWLSILIDLAIRAIFLSYRFNKVTKILA